MIIQQTDISIWARRSWTGAWRLQPNAAVERWRHGSGSQAGYAQITAVRSSADLREIGADITDDLEPGAFVAIANATIRDGSGSISQDPAFAEAFWQGYVVGVDTTSEGRSAASYRERRTIQAVGLAGLLAQVSAHRQQTLIYGGGIPTPQIVATPPIFAEHNLDDAMPGAEPNTWYVRRLGNGQRWTARAMLQSLLDANLGPGASKRIAHWPQFLLMGQLDCLDYEISGISPSGTLMDALNALATPRSGCTWSVIPPPMATPTAPCSLWIDSTLPDPITITTTTGTRTIPANERQSNLDATKPHTSFAHSVGLPRELILSGRRVAIVNLRWSASGAGELTRDWLASDDDQAGDDRQEYARVFRSWLLRHDWAGTYQRSIGSGDPIQLSSYQSTQGTIASPHDLYGSGGLTGDLDYSESFPPWPAQLVRLLPNLNIPSGWRQINNGPPATLSDWLSDPSGHEPEPASEPMQPMAFLHDRARNEWSPLGMQIAIQDERRVIIGSGPDDAANLAAALGDGNVDLVVVVAIEMPIPLSVSYVPAVPVGAIRHIQIPWAEQIVYCGRCMLGLNDDGDPIGNNSDRIVRTDLPAMRSLLALRRTLDDAPATCTFIDQSSLRTDILVGDMVEAITTGPSSSQTVRQVVTSIEHVAIMQGYGTIITTEQPKDDTEATA